MANVLATTDHDWLHACWSDEHLRQALLEAQDQHGVSVIGLLFQIRHTDRLRRLERTDIDRLTQASRRNEVALRRLRRLRRGVAALRDARALAAPERQRLDGLYAVLGDIELQREWSHWEALMTRLERIRLACPDPIPEHPGPGDLTADANTALARLEPRIPILVRSRLAERLARMIRGVPPRPARATDTTALPTQPTPRKASD